MKTGEAGVVSEGVVIQEKDDMSRPVHLGDSCEGKCNDHSYGFWDVILPQFSNV
jgi:hypothetical protein